MSGRRPLDTILWLLVVASTGCPLPPATPIDQPPALTSRRGADTSIILTERGPAGGRLVFARADGDRWEELLPPSVVPSRDVGAAFSPDGRYVAFASSRGRPLNESSIWMVEIDSETRTPVRLTDGAGIDVSPVWTPDSQSIVFASSREGGNLYRIAVGAAGRAPERLTTSDSIELSPSFAPDGTLVYAALSVANGGKTESWIEKVSPGRAPARLTAGPLDSSPEVSPDGVSVAFTRPVARRVGNEVITDTDVFVTPLDGQQGGKPKLALSVPFTDETAPVWSPDGRFLFATSVARASEGKPLLSSVVVTDLHDPSGGVRMFVDRTGATTRMDVAVRGVLDADALNRLPSYREELSRVLLDSAASNEAPN